MIDSPGASHAPIQSVGLFDRSTGVQRCRPMTDELSLDDLPQPEWKGSVSPQELEVDGDNPNEMDDELFALLSDRIQERGWIGNAIITDLDGLIVDGEHRWRAAKDIDLTTVPVKRYDFDDGERRLIRQELNKISGSHITRRDAFEYDRILDDGYSDPIEELAEATGDDIEELLDDLAEEQSLSGAFDDDNASGLKQPPESGNGSNDANEEWESFGEVEYGNEDQSPDHTIKVHFDTTADLESFAELLGQTITEKTQTIYYPEQEQGNHKDKRFVNEAAD